MRREYKIFRASVEGQIAYHTEILKKSPHLSPSTSRWKFNDFVVSFYITFTKKKKKSELQFEMREEYNGVLKK